MPSPTSSIRASSRAEASSSSCPSSMQLPWPQWPRTCKTGQSSFRRLRFHMVNLPSYSPASTSLLHLLHKVLAPASTNFRVGLVQGSTAAFSVAAAKCLGRSRCGFVGFCGFCGSCLDSCVQFSVTNVEQSTHSIRKARVESRSGAMSQCCLSTASSSGLLPGARSSILCHSFCLEVWAVLGRLAVSAPANSGWASGTHLLEMLQRGHHILRGR